MNKTSKIVVLVIFSLVLIGGGYYFYQSKKASQTPQVLLENNKSEQKTMNNLTSKKEWHIVTINGLNVNIKMSVNGFVIFSDDLQGSASIAGLKLNPFLVNGDNKVEITATKIPNEYNNTSCNFPFGVADLSVTDTISYNPNKIVCSDVLKDKGVENFTYTINADIQNPAWVQSEKIGKDAVTQKKILDKYKEFHRLLEQKDLDGMMKFSDAKFKEYSKSMYDPDFASNMKNSIKEMFANPPGELIGIEVQEKNGLRYEYSYGDRLISIKNDEDTSIIFYGDGYTTTQFDLFFYFDGKDFVLIL